MSHRVAYYLLTYSREMTSGRAMDQAGTVDSTIYILTRVFDGHQHNFSEARAQHHTI
jgi:hypothetical protein